MQTVGLLLNEQNPAALNAAQVLTEALHQRPDVTLLARPLIAQQVNASGGLCCGASDSEIARADFVVVFGGDGTLLAAARLLAPHNTPLLGIHLGHFGFITEAPPDDLLSAVHEALTGKALVEERMMLQGVIHRGGNQETSPDDAPLLAMNDIVAASGAVRMVHIETRIGSDRLATYAADGVIVASPTGSTGYSLSAGGPLVHPTAPVLIVTPICPHTLNARTLIVPDTETVYLTALGQSRDRVVVSVDGQIEIPLEPGDTVSVSRSPFSVRFLTVGGPNFYQKIRDRWHYGERVSQ